MARRTSNKNAGSQRKATISDDTAIMAEVISYGCRYYVLADDLNEDSVELVMVPGQNRRIDDPNTALVQEGLTFADALARCIQLVAHDRQETAGIRSITLPALPTAAAGRGRPRANKAAKAKKVGVNRGGLAAKRVGRRIGVGKAASKAPVKAPAKAAAKAPARAGRKAGSGLPTPTKAVKAAPAANRGGGLRGAANRAERMRKLAASKKKASGA